MQSLGAQWVGREGDGYWTSPLAVEGTSTSVNETRMHKIPLKFRPWFEARHRFKLSHEQIQMARELGMNPKKFGSLANEKQQPWKLPLPEFIAQCYFKRFNRQVPSQVHSLEQLIDAKEMTRKRKQEKKAKETSRVESPP